MDANLRELLESILGNCQELKLNSSYETIPQWDSLAQVNITAGLEDMYSISLTIDEIAELKSVTSIIATLEKHGVVLKPESK